MNYTSIFTDLDDFRSYADGLQADTVYRQLHPSLRATAMEMEKVITKNVFNALAAPVETPADPEPAAAAAEPAAAAAEPAAAQEATAQTPDLAEGRELLKIALAAGTLYRYQIFSTVKKAGSDAALYKYQHEELKATYIENYWKAMDELLDWLDANKSVGGWESSTDYTDRQALPVRSAEEFHHYFGIERSSYFYAKALYLVRDVWAKIRPAVIGHTENEKVMEAAKKALCYRVIAKVVMTWDLTEFPRSIRFDYNHEYSKGSSTADRDRLYHSLLSEAAAAEAEMDAIKRHSSGADAVGNTNEERDKFYLSI